MINNYERICNGAFFYFRTMKHSETIKFYIQLLETLKSPKVFNRKQLIDHLNDTLQFDTPIENRSFHRKLKELRDEFHINVQFNASLGAKGGYEINHTDSPGIENTENSFAALGASIRIHDNILNLGDLEGIVQTSSPISALNSTNFSMLIHAVKNKKKITFRYFKPGEPEQTYLISPLILKEYHHKWYIVGTHHCEEGNILKVFGVKRLNELQITDEKADLENFEFAKQQIKKAIGISFLHKEPEKVTIAATKTQARFFDSHILHPSQKKIKEGSEVDVYELNVIVNYELKMKLFSYGSTLRVLGPESLKKWYLDTINVMKKHASQEQIDLDNASIMFG